MKRNYNKEIFNKLNIKTYDIDCYMNNMFTFKEKKKVLDLWSLFRNRFDVDIQTIFSQKDKGKKKIFKDINYANFFKNDLIDYKNLKKYGYQLYGFHDNYKL
ncbi:hypothetical protein PFFCH_04396 [Plasmodium falciparum FCH/4]|uniref:Uncharacterized protein n=1 Tax=Plasmodium falciparum FCH/4 TaxID=1036724 RepID=A0A024VHN4_PLAFA|nr:hypothetical protein PFFCH_04396 [Plasmodium falciparum FCH/4]